MHRILHLECADDRAGREQLEAQTPTRHLVHALDVVLRELVEDVLLGPRALETPGDCLGTGDIRCGNRPGGCRNGAGCRRLQERAPALGPT